MRRLVLAFGSTVEATTTVLAVTMGGLALGGLWGGRWASRAQARPLRDYAILETGIAGAAAIRPFGRGQGFFGSAEESQRVTQASIGNRKVGIEFERPLQFIDGSILLGFDLVDPAKGHMGERVLLIQRDRLARIFLRL